MRLFFTTVLVAISVVVSVEAAVSSGYPYIDVTVSPADPADQDHFSQDYFRNQIGIWLKGNEAAKFGSLAVPTGVLFEDFVNVSGQLSWKITIDPAAFGDGVVYYGLNATNSGSPTSPLEDIFNATNYIVANHTLVGNFAPLVSMSLSTPFRLEYNGTWSQSLSLTLNHAPLPGNKVVVRITNASLSVDTDPIEIAYPSQNVSFKLFGATNGTFPLGIVIDAATTNSSRFVLPAGNPSITFLPKQEVTITPPASNVLFYNQSKTDNFKITVPSSYRDHTFALKVTVRSSPAGLSIYSADNYLTTRGSDYTFYCVGPTGTFTLRYEIALPSGATSADNNNFAPITTVTTLVINPSLNVSVGGIPNGYMVNAPTSVDYGGAFSLPVNIYIERPPKVDLLLYITAPGVEISTPIFSFSPGGSTMRTFKLRSLSTGLKTISFSLGGSSASDYLPPAPRSWLVLSSNPNCITRTTPASCFATSGCQYYDDRGYCSNRSLPIVITPIPTLYHEETSQNLSLILPTAVQNSVSIQFVAPTTLLFSPALFDLAPGAKVLTFTVTGTLTRPSDGDVTEAFSLRLSGTDANYYKQSEFHILIVPRTSCTLDAKFAFFVDNDSPTFTLTCDRAPEEQAIFTPVAIEGIEFIFDSVDGANLTNTNTSTPSVIFSTSTKVLTFHLKSVLGVVGRFDINWNITGINGERYDAVDTFTVSILPHAELNPLPHFRLAAFTESPSYNLDLTYIPSAAFNVTIAAVFLANGTLTETVQFLPSNVIEFNATNRQSVQVFATEPGIYQAVYTLHGDEAKYFQVPVNSTFEIKDPGEGSAFTYNQQLGHQPKTACRVNVGMNSQTFTGQDQVSTGDMLCKNIINLPFNMSNGSTVCPQQKTDVRCKYILSSTGQLCAWHRDACVYLPELQGNVTDVSYGSSFTVFVATNGSVYSIGKTSYGQLGHKSDWLDRVVLPNNENASSVVSGTSFTVVLSTTGRLFSWGANYRGQLGIGVNMFSSQAIQEVPLPKFTTVTCISAGSEHAGALTDTGTLYMWGSNNYGQTGNLATFRGFHRQIIAVSRDGFDGDAVTHFQCGSYHTMVATDTKAYTFGNNNRGQLGRPGWDEYTPGPTVLYTASDFVDAPTYPSFLLGSVTCSTGDS